MSSENFTDNTMEDRTFDALTPKDETQSSRFLAEHPAFDGRGVIVAVLDTGIDPGASGLAFTPDGRPKIIDMVECSGSGDVDTSSTCKADSTGAIKVGSRWYNVSHVHPYSTRNFVCAFSCRVSPDAHYY
jgi:hypothetical protein